MENKYHHIAIYGYPRSGSTLFYCMLRASVRGYRFYDWELKARKAARQDPGMDKITKNPGDHRDVEWLSRHVEGVGFILCIRDPRSVLVSKSNDGMFKVDWDHCKHKRPGSKTLRQNEGLIERHHDIMRQLPEDVYVCRYERLVKSPGKVQEELKRRFGFKYEDRFENFHNHPIPPKLARRLNGIRKAGTERLTSWRDYPERIHRQFTECPELFDIVQYWGYEKDNDWFKEIEQACKHH